MQQQGDSFVIILGDVSMHSFVIWEAALSPWPNLEEQKLDFSERGIEDFARWS
ncbi:unnamed protein product [Linum tenue]|uniref:Uncharacterized protein n=1 Tax=Linum tenue TaxID=586396 RepID=A0AAV0I364_9ROSI|nr:unnamed protein product [Linum tenue]